MIHRLRRLSRMRPSLVVVVVFVAAMPLWWLDRSRSRDTRIVHGVVTMFETNASRGGHGRSVTVRLDDGVVARASNPMSMTAPVGSRVELSEHVGLLTGIRRYGLRQVLENER
jgi:hypothetical protein